MKIVEISGTLERGMWDGTPFYPPFQVQEVPSEDWPKGKGKMYGQAITFGAQQGTSITTGAHLYPSKPSIGELPLERFITDAVIVKTSVSPKERITLEQLKAALNTVDQRPKKGEALLISTRWERYWNKQNFLSDSPRFAHELIEWVIDKHLGILGSDVPAWDAEWEEGFWPELYAADTLVLAPLVNLTKVSVSRAKLYALPLKIKGACGSPCRAFLQIEKG